MINSCKVSSNTPTYLPNMGGCIATVVILCSSPSIKFSFLTCPTYKGQKYKYFFPSPLHVFSWQVQVGGDSGEQMQG